MAMCICKAIGLRARKDCNTCFSMMIYIFKTSVLTENDMQALKPYLDRLPQVRWNFDLEDCDKILRIESLKTVSEEAIIKILNDSGFACDLLLAMPIF